MLRTEFSIFLLIIISACGTPPVKQYSEKIQVESADFQFIDNLLASNEIHPPSRIIDVWLTLPENARFKPPYPAVILLHSSWGLSSQESHYANIFKAMGIATFSIDSFTTRGVEKTSLNQTSVSSASMLNDAYTVLKYINDHNDYDANRAAVMGFSKGGIAAFYSAMNKIQHLLSIDDLKFAAHIAYYPWCGLHLYEMQTTGAPILIQGGSKDIVTPIKHCTDLVENSLIDKDKTNIEIKEYPDARHAFDHPTLGKIPIPFTLTMDAQVPKHCRIQEYKPGKFIEEYKNTEVTHKNISEVLSACSEPTGVAKYNRKAARIALFETKEFLKTHLLNKP